MHHTEVVSNKFCMCLNTVKEAAWIREQQLAALGGGSKKRKSSLQVEVKKEKRKNSQSGEGLK